MDQNISIKIEGLKRISEVGLPQPQEEGDNIIGVYFLADLDSEYAFRLGTYNVEEDYFRSDNGYGGEIWDTDTVVAWNYFICDEGEDIKVSIL